MLVQHTVDGLFEQLGRRDPGSVTELRVGGRGGVPADADGVMLNVTAVDAGSAGFLTVWPCGSTQPLASNVNYNAGDTVPNAVLSKVGANGNVCIFTLAAVDLVVDVNGFVPAGGSPSSLVPARLLESRVGEHTVDGLFEQLGRRDPGTCDRAAGWGSWWCAGRRGRGDAERHGGGCGQCWVLDGVAVWVDAAVGVECELQRW